MELAMAVFGGWLLYHENEVLFSIVAILMVFYGVIVPAYIKPPRTANLQELEAQTRQNSTIKEVIDSIYDIRFCRMENYSWIFGGFYVLER